MRVSVPPGPRTNLCRGDEAEGVAVLFSILVQVLDGIHLTLEDLKRVSIAEGRVLNVVGQLHKGDDHGFVWRGRGLEMYPGSEWFFWPKIDPV